MLIGSSRPLSSSTYDDQPPTSFPLYRPTPTPQAPYESQPHHQYTDHRSLPSDKKIRKATKIQLTEKAIQDLPELEEEDLRSFYAAVMESGRTVENDLPQIEDRMTVEERSKVIEGLAGRFIGTEAGPSKLPALNTGLRQKVVSGIVDKLRAIKAPIAEEGGARIPLGLVSRTEWGVLLDEMAGRDGREAENLMDLMSVSHCCMVKYDADPQVHGTYPDGKQVTQVMQSYARDGRVEDVVRIHTLLAECRSPISKSQIRANLKPEHRCPRGSTTS
jgi:hypothetical protein